ncbi:DUF4184 family protein [Microbacterium sp. zg.Y909]|uniref:DUF4184 family protein n=1 Tax=Microbacterium sp. zg.Y909 TaxID=2969413 RepID=UPI00214CA919|nr:DUF4184 family protein [Microbacterium sp. zg.Y909]MCR2827777.1 DUF4184 family protein [Microbacterium sp. zg.Y909]
MPFTPSHALVALPFLRTPLVPAAIAVGAMTPDLPLFVRGTPLTYAVTHSRAGLLVTVAVALLLLLVWRCVLRPAVRELSPRWLAVRLPQEWDTPFGPAARSTLGLSGEGPRRWATPVILALSLLLGVLSHIGWDELTHADRWGVVLFPVLDERWGPLVGYKWLQHGSSVVGMIVLAVCATLWLRRRSVVPIGPAVAPAWVRWTWWLSLPATLVAAWGIGLAVYGPLTPGFGVEHLAYRMLPPACGVWGAVTIAVAVGVQVARARRARVAGVAGGASTPPTSA